MGEEGQPGGGQTGRWFRGPNGGGGSETRSGRGCHGHGGGGSGGGDGEGHGALAKITRSGVMGDGMVGSCVE